MGIKLCRGLDTLRSKVTIIGSFALYVSYKRIADAMWLQLADEPGKGSSGFYSTDLILL